MSSSSKPAFEAFKGLYEPNEAAAIIFVILFTGTLVAHIYQAVRAKSWLTWALIVSVACEVLGYTLRELCIRNRKLMAPYIVSQVTIIIAPALLCGNLYMFVGRAMGYVGPSFSLVRPTWITGIFIGFDILSIATQGFGSTLIVRKDVDMDRLKLGRLVLILGLFIQLIAFLVFLFFTIWFDWKSTKVLGPKRVARLRWLLNAFYISGALIMIRSAYRAVEFIELDFTRQRASKGLYFQEWAYYVLDALPIFVATAVFNVWFPPDFIPKEYTTTLDQEKQRIASEESINATELGQVQAPRE